MIGVSPNATYAGKAVSYLEPALPWPGPANRPADEKTRATALARLFHKAHAADWCAVTTGATLDALKAHVQDAALDTEGKQAACSACIEVTSRHVRLGASAAAYDATKEPLCTLLDSASAVVYQVPVVPGDVTGAARTYCGCP